LVDFEGVFGGFGNDGYLSFQSEKLLPTIKALNLNTEHLRSESGDPRMTFFFI